MTQVLVAAQSDTEGLAMCLAVSYRDNPLFKWMFDDELDEGLLRGIFSGLVDSAIPQACVYKTPRNVGAAIWNEPRAAVPSSDVPVDAPANLGTSAGRRTAALAVLKGHRPIEPHMYLAAVGVVPGERRRGLASALLAPVLEQCDATKTDAYLENSDPRNTSFYERLGFSALGALPMPVGCPEVVAMTRRAASQAAK